MLYISRRQNKVTLKETCWCILNTWPQEIQPFKAASEDVH